MAHGQLGAQVPQRDALHVMLHGQMGQQLVAEESFGKDSSRSSGESAVTTATVTLRQFITDDLLAYRIHFNNGAWFTALGVQGAAAVRASLPSRHRFLTRNFRVRNVAATMTRVAGFGAASALRIFRWRIGFERHLGRRSRGTKGAFLGRSLLVAQPGFEPNNFLLQPVDDQLPF